MIASGPIRRVHRALPRLAAISLIAIALLLAFAFACAFALTPAVSAAPDWTVSGWSITEISPGLSGISVAQVNSKYVLFTAGDDAARDIYYYDIAAGRSRRVTQQSLSGSFFPMPQMDGDWIVYKVKNGSGTDIVLYNIVTSATRRITGDGNYNQTPRISGDYVAYRGGTGTAMDVYLYRISTAKTTRLTTPWERGDSAVNNYWDGDTDYISIDGDYLAWRGYKPGAGPGESDMDVIAYSISQAKFWRIATSYNDASPQVHGSRLVWNQFGGSPSVNRMCFYDLASSLDQFTILSEAGLTAYISSPDRAIVDDQRVAWVESETYTSSYIHVRKLGVVDTFFGTTPYANSPALAGPAVAWIGGAQSYGSGEVYACAFASAETVQLSGAGHGAALAATSEMAAGEGNVAWVGTGRSSLYLATINQPPAQTHPFADVPGSHYYSEAIDNLFWFGVIDGQRFTGGLRYYAPDDTVKRAQFAKMIIGSLGVPVEPEGAPVHFVDLGAQNSSDPYPHEFVATILKYGITEGRDYTHYAPWDDVRRSQVISMLVRAAKNLNPDALSEPPSGWSGALSAYYGDPNHGANVKLAEYNGLLDHLEGFGASWEPTAPATRAEVAQLMWNYMQLAWFAL